MKLTCVVPPGSVTVNPPVAPETLPASIRAFTAAPNCSDLRTTFGPVSVTVT
jgi:hypothetical protein